LALSNQPRRNCGCQFSLQLLWQKLNLLEDRSNFGVEFHSRIVTFNPSTTTEFLITTLQNRQKRFLRDIHAAHAFHPLFAFLLLLEQLCAFG